jgi:hypothetical protein
MNRRWPASVILALIATLCMYAPTGNAQAPCYQPQVSGYQAPQFFAGSSYAFSGAVSPPVYYSYSSHYPGSNSTYYGMYPPSYYSGYPQTTYINPGPYYYTPAGAYSPSYYSYYYTPGYFRY